MRAEQTVGEVPPSPAGYVNQVLTFGIVQGDEQQDVKFVLRRCDECWSLVAPGDEDRHNAWHDDLEGGRG